MAAPPSRRASPPVLTYELVEEILLRLPPDDPACLLRASVVCKNWSSAVSHPSFRRRLYELHRTPPMLGFFHNWYDEGSPRFIPTTASSFSLAAPDCRSWRALDFRHGRALFLSKRQDTQEILLWEPITGAQQRIPVPVEVETSRAAVLCAADGCDHRDCHGGPFRIVFVFSVENDTDDEDYVTSACVYSSETSTWGELTSMHMRGEFSMRFTYHSSVLVGRSLLYFMSDGELILEYDLARQGLTVFDAPTPVFRRAYAWTFNLMLAENGGLGVSEIFDPHLKLWSREASDGTNARWVLSRVIYLGNLLPIGNLVDRDDRLCVEGFAVGANVIFISADAGVFRIELQTERVRKVSSNRGIGDCNLIPVVSFYTPHSRLEALGGKQHDLLLPPNPTEDRGGEDEKVLERAQDLFDKGCKAIEDRDFTNAIDCFTRVLEIRVSHYGELSPECASTFYRYGRALLCKALEVTNPSDKVLKSVPDEESVKTTTVCSKDDPGSSEASGSIIEHVLPSEKGETLNGKDQEDVNMTCDEANSDLHLAWKMLDIAREIVAKSPENTMEKVDIFCALAEVSMKREDRDTAIGYYLGALAILEHLARPDHIRVVLLNFRIFELASKIGDAIPYCAKAISVCQSCLQNLKNAKEALLADKHVSASAAKGHSGKFTLEDKISVLSRTLARFRKKLEKLEQTMSA